MKVALITGAGSGIGQACAVKLAEDGYTLVLTGRHRESLETTAELVEKSLVLPADVGDASSVDHLFDTIGQRWGRLDLLFNNAGTGTPPIPVDELTVEQWRRVIDTNLTGAFLCARRAFALMKSQSPPGGRIINNGSVSAHAPRPNSVAYTATKHGVTGLTKSLSLDGRRYGIACGQIDIGNAATAMTQRMAHGVPQADGSIKPEPTMAVQDVARAVSFMASLPTDSNIQFMTIMATNMPYVGRG